ncbi:hypothetical protein UPYG_G00092220 [Umbra pygmaea]|uniref:Uncharacterized protein n=1 Tax=Umbra pygmaea TaxID=75934 RepID=A0ABD0XJC1_UMBPY
MDRGAKVFGALGQRLYSNRMRRAAKKEEPATYERLVYKNTSVYHYMSISLEFENEETLSPAQLKQFIVNGLKDIYGEVGGAFPFDLLKFDELKLTAILRVYNSGLVKLWSALTLLSSFDQERCAVRVNQERCAVRVNQVSPFLLALSGNSRELELH